MNSVKQKKDYIHWFLNFRLKKAKAARLLLNLSHTPHLLNQVVFVNDISGKDNSILVSARGTSTFPFICRVNGLYYSDPEDAFEALLHLPEKKKLYLCLSYPERPATPELLAEDSEVDDEMVKSLQAIWQKLAREEIMQEIDAALDNNDKEEFLRLTQKLKRIDG